MVDRASLLEEACNALVCGDAGRCQQALGRFEKMVARRPLTVEERNGCSTQLRRLRALAAAAAQGVGSAQDWLHQLADMIGGLDVYDSRGRQRVPTGVSTPSQRF